MANQTSSATHRHAPGAHAHDHAHGPDCEHGGLQACSHQEIQSERQLLFYMLGFVLLVTARVCALLGVDETIADLPAIIAVVFLSVPLFGAAWKELKRGAPSSSTLAALGILAATAVAKYEPAGWLAFILLVADQIVNRTAFGAQRAISALVQLTPDVARTVGADGAEQEVPLENVRVGQTVRVRPGENLPVDGRVSRGRSSINQASLTGEAVPVEVQEGDPVYAGTSNLTGGIDVVVTQVGAETTIGKVSQLIREAESTRTPRQLLIEQVARFFVPVAISVAGVVLFINSQNPETKSEAAIRAVTVLVVCCPASLLLASPSAMVAAFAAAARLGVMVKKTNYLESAGNIDAAVFDKTGTITTGKFGVSRLSPAPGVEGAELLRAAANGEQNSNHPLALSIISTARQARIELDGSGDYEEVHGRGVRARTSMGEACVGRASWLMELNPSIRPLVAEVEQRIEGMTGVHVMLDNRYLGAVGLEDKVRPNAAGVVQRLRDLGVRTVAIFTGDRLSVARRVGLNVGADAIEAECLPEEKHQQIERLKRQGHRVLMVGDGINDGPSLAAADVGVAMGLSGSDIATNSAGVALLTDELNRIPYLIELSRKTRIIIAQNIGASILIVLVGLVLASSGLLAVPAAALYHFVGEVFVLANSFRLFRFGEEIIQAEKPDTEAFQRRSGSIRRLAAQPA